MHQSIPSVNISRATPGVLHPFSAQVLDLLSVIKVPSYQLMLHEGTFQLQTDLPSIAALKLQNLFQSWGKTLKTLSMVLKLKLEGMTKE